MQPPPAQPPMQPPPSPGYSQQPVPYGLPDAQNAMLSMILGIVSLVLTPFCCFTGFGLVIPLGLGIAASVLGFMARGKIAAAPGTLGGSGKALTGIITGLIAVGLSIILLIAILLFRAALPSILNSLPSPTAT